MKNKKLVIIIAAIVVVLTAVGVLLISLSDTTPRIGVFLNEISSETQKSNAAMLQETLKKQGYEVQVFDAGNDQATQNRQVQEQLKKGCSGMIICPVMPDATEKLVQSAKKEGAEIVFLERQPSKEIMELWDGVSYVGCDASQPGSLQAQMILQMPNGCDVNDDGILSYVLLQDDLEYADTLMRTEDVRKGLSEKTTVAELHAGAVGNTQELAEEACKKLLANYGKDIELIVCTNDTIALGAIKAIQDGGRTVGKDIFLVGAQGDAKALAKINAGEMSATVLCNTKVQMQRAAALLLQLIRKEDAVKYQYIDHVAITKENVKKYLK